MGRRCVVEGWHRCYAVGVSVSEAVEAIPACWVCHVLDC